MVTRETLKEWVVEALSELGGSGPQIEVAKIVWRRHENDLRQSGDVFYRWQYDLRWAATSLRKEGRLEENSPGKPWRLSSDSALLKPAPSELATSVREKPSVWTEEEHREVVAAFARMYRRALVGEDRRRAEEIARAVKHTGRSRSSIERRLCNISAVMIEHGQQPLTGFAPLSHVGPQASKHVVTLLRQEGLIS